MTGLTMRMYVTRIRILMKNTLLSSPIHLSLSFSLQDSSGANHMQLRRTRRSRIPDKPNYSLNLWSIMKNCIGKDLSKIPMPVNSGQICILH